MCTRLLAVIALPAVLASSYVYASAPQVSNFADLSLEQLSEIEVTSVSRRPERLKDAAASIYVITAADIRRSGVSTLPEALRLAPNLQVARLNSSSYAISSRGFNNSTGNKLLVLIDGRTVYTPLFSGVFWDAQDVMLEDIERIEVISGPGATLWGANAVNGVINVITRPARDTQGALVSAGAGNRTQIGAARFGRELASGGHYRVYGRYFNQENTERPNGASVADDWNRGQIGFRSDWGGAERGFTLQGDVYRGELEQAAPGTQRAVGVNLLGRWNRRLSENSNLHVQAYYDRTQRTIPGTFAEHLDLFDLEFQHALQPSKSHEVLWGGGYRWATDRVDNSAGLAFLPADKILRWANVFVQDEIALRDNLDLTLGLKAESNVYTNIEWLPSARLAWKVAPGHLLWGAASRAVRAPSRLDRELFSPRSPPFLLAGGPDFKSEVSKVLELGYRGHPTSALSYSITAFHHNYDRLRSFEPTAGGNFVLDNKIEGSGNGVEAWGTYHVTRAWQLSAGWVELRQRLGRQPDSRDPTGPRSLGNDPRHQWMLRSAFNPSDKYEIDVAVRHVGTLPDPVVPSYTAVDMRLGWRVSREVEWSLTGQNLFGPGHLEFGAPAAASLIERSVLLKLVWRP